MTPMLEVERLSVRLEQKDIIENVSFTLEKGESLSIIGPNGSGKTVLLKALLNTIPYSGEIKWARGVKIGYVPQKIEADRGLPLSLKNLFASKCELVKAPRSDILEIPQSVGLTRETLDTPIGNLSGGQFQRGLIAFALIGRPTVLLFDEPTSSIDKPSEEHIYELLYRLQQEYQLTLLIVSHDLSFVYRYATRVLCLNKQGICLGAPRETLTTEVLERLYGDWFKYYEHAHQPGDRP
jgi:zinc transport system ATP-binding protein